MIPYAATWVELSNLSLAKLGQTPILNLEDGQNGAYCTKHLGAAIEEALTGYPYRSIQRTVQLARTVETPHYFRYKYALPSDLIKIIEIDTGGEDYAYEEEGLLTDAEEVWLTYVPEPESPAVLPRYLRHLIVIILSQKLSREYGAGQEIMQYLEIEYQRAQQRAMAEEAARYFAEDPVPWYDEGR